MNFLKKAYIYLLTLSLPLVSSAQDTSIFPNPIKSKTFTELMDVVLKVLIQIGIPVLVLFIVYAGFQFITAQGNEAKVTAAKEALFWSVVGGAVLLGAKIIESVIQNTIKSL